MIVALNRGKEVSWSEISPNRSADSLLSSWDGLSNGDGTLLPIAFAVELVVSPEVASLPHELVVAAFTALRGAELPNQLWDRAIDIGRVLMTAAEEPTRNLAFVQFLADAPSQHPGRMHALLECAVWHPIEHVRWTALEALPGARIPPVVQAPSLTTLVLDARNSERLRRASMEQLLSFRSAAWPASALIPVLSGCDPVLSEYEVAFADLASSSEEGRLIHLIKEEPGIEDRVAAYRDWLSENGDKVKADLLSELILAGRSENSTEGRADWTRIERRAKSSILRYQTHLEGPISALLNEARSPLVPPQIGCSWGARGLSGVYASAERFLVVGEAAGRIAALDTLELAAEPHELDDVESLSRLRRLLSSSVLLGISAVSACWLPGGQAQFNRILGGVTPLRPIDLVIDGFRFTLRSAQGHPLTSPSADIRLAASSDRRLPQHIIHRPAAAHRFDEDDLVELFE